MAANVNVKFTQSAVLAGESDPVAIGDVRSVSAELAEALVAENAAELVRDTKSGAEKASTSATGRRAKPKG